MAFKVPEKYRIQVKGLEVPDTETERNYGAFRIPFIEEDGAVACVIASDGEGWEHVSVHIKIHGDANTPTWEEMCIIKDLFWDKEDCVVQFHPPESEYVNCHPHCLHLWRPSNTNIQTPPSELVGPKK